MRVLRRVHPARGDPPLHAADRRRTIDKPCRNCGHKIKECPNCKHPVDKKAAEYDPESFLMKQVSKAPKKGKIVIGRPED